MIHAAGPATKRLLAGFLLGSHFLALPALAQSIDCVFPHNAANRGWMPSAIRLNRDPETGSGEVLDRVTLEFAGGPVALRTTRADENLVTFSWTLKVHDDTHKMATLLYRLTWLKPPQRAQLVMLALGYSNIYTAQGTCTLDPRDLPAATLPLATD